MIFENERLKTMAAGFAESSENLENGFKNFQSARVINNSTNKRYNFITIDKGYQDGVNRDMGVISSEGVVGIVKNTSKRFASIISVLHLDFKLSCKHRAKEYFGSLTWDGRDARLASITDIPGHADIAIGDEFVTSGFGAIFPADIMVGVVSNIVDIPGSSFQKIEIKLSVDYYRLHNTYIVSNELRDEQLELEQTTKSE